MVFDMPDCGGCRTCELACSFHHKKVFNPVYSSIKIQDKNDFKGYKIIFVENNEGITCDGCKGCMGRACLDVCEKKEILNSLINKFLKSQRF